MKNTAAASFRYGYQVRGVEGGAHTHYFDSPMPSLEFAIEASIRDFLENFGSPTTEQESVATNPERMLVGILVSDHGRSKIQNTDGRNQYFATLTFHDGTWRRN